MNCPACRQADQVEKVSTIYVRGIEVKWRAGKTGPPNSDEASPKRSKLMDAMPANDLQALTRRLAPPAAKKEAPMRAIHPDMMVLGFSLVAPIFLYGMWTSQRPVLPVVIAILVCAYALYFWQRKAILARFQRNQASRQSAEERARRGVERWMSLYYCHRDDGVFPAHSGQLIPTDQMPGYLFRPES